MFQFDLNNIPDKNMKKKTVECFDTIVIAVLKYKKFAIP